MNKYSYEFARALFSASTVLFFSQIILEVAGVADRKPEFWWVIPVCAAFWIASIIYSVVLIILNARIELNKEAE